MTSGIEILYHDEKSCHHRSGAVHGPDISCSVAELYVWKKKEQKQVTE